MRVREKEKRDKKKAQGKKNKKILTKQKKREKKNPMKKVNPYGSVHVCTPPGRQPGSLPPSLAPVCVSRSLSLPGGSLYFSNCR